MALLRDDLRLHISFHADGDWNPGDDPVRELLDISCPVFLHDCRHILLVPGYAKVTLADIRYLPSSQMGKYLTFTDQDVLFLYSAPVLNNSETLK